MLLLGPLGPSVQKQTAITWECALSQRYASVSVYYMDTFGPSNLQATIVISNL